MIDHSDFKHSDGVSDISWGIGKKAFDIEGYQLGFGGIDRRVYRYASCKMCTRCTYIIYRQIDDSQIPKWLNVSFPIADATCVQAFGTLIHSHKLTNTFTHARCVRKSKTQT